MTYDTIAVKGEHMRTVGLGSWMVACMAIMLGGCGSDEDTPTGVTAVQSGAAGAGGGTGGMNAGGGSAGFAVAGSGGLGGDGGSGGTAGGAGSSGSGGSGGSSQSGQIVVDPNSPAWFVYDGGGPFFLCGPGDPEDFLYRGTRNVDGTRDGDQMQLISKLAPTGANGIYLQAVRSHGGDGDADHNPFVDSGPSQGLSNAILEQWETWFTAMDDAGIVIYFFFYDDSARIWDTGDQVGFEERAFLEGIVNRFEHHRHLMWVVGEEYSERYSRTRVSNIAAAIRGADDNDHVIGVHQLTGVSFDFPDDPNIDQFSIQYNVGTADALHAGMLMAWNQAAGRYNLNMSESADHGTGATGRHKNWAAALGGAYVMPIGWDIGSTPVSDLEQCGSLVRFMESTTFQQMAPHDELATGGTLYELADPPRSYIAYARSLSGEMGLRDRII